MSNDYKDLLEQIMNLPTDWHAMGSLSNDVIKAIMNHSKELDLEHTIETGSGKSTLLFSNISKHHLVFSIDKNSSISMVKSSPIFQKDSVEFIEGPTQKTISEYKFDFKVQLVLIDGPHGYPFPDLEYYYLYPILDTGALLIIDDIHIPSIKNMFNFIKADDMFQFLGLQGKTAFLRRTSSPTFDTFGDGWWEQAYNKSVVDQMQRWKKIRKTFLKKVKIPEFVKRVYWKYISR